MNAKIYKMSDAEGYFYYGSTCMPLNKRKSFHKHKSNAEGSYGKAIRHFKEVGWDLVRIELMEDLPNCTDKIDLLRTEDKYIKDALKDPLCLNTNRSFMTVDETRNRRILQVRERRANDPQHREDEAKKALQWYNDHKDRAKENHLNWVENNKEYNDEKRREKITCDICGKTIIKREFKRHKKSKYCKPSA